jgi:hypothetical protein
MWVICITRAMASGSFTRHRARLSRMTRHRLRVGVIHRRRPAKRRVFVVCRMTRIRWIRFQHRRRRCITQRRLCRRFRRRFRKQHDVWSNKDWVFYFIDLDKIRGSIFVCVGVRDLWKKFLVICRKDGKSAAESAGSVPADERAYFWLSLCAPDDERHGFSSCGWAHASIDCGDGSWANEVESFGGGEGGYADGNRLVMSDEDGW